MEVSRKLRAMLGWAQSLFLNSMGQRSHRPAQIQEGGETAPLLIGVGRGTLHEHQWVGDAAAAAAGDARAHECGGERAWTQPHSLAQVPPRPGQPCNLRQAIQTPCASALSSTKRG